MLRSLQALTLALLAVVLCSGSASARSAPLVLWIESASERTEKHLPCAKRCAALRKVIQTAMAPRRERWFCQNSPSTEAAFQAGVTRRGRTIALFTPHGSCGIRQWQMIKGLYRRHLPGPFYDFGIHRQRLS